MQQGVSLPIPRLGSFYWPDDNTLICDHSHLARVGNTAKSYLRTIAIQCSYKMEGGCKCNDLCLVFRWLQRQQGCFPCQAAESSLDFSLLIVFTFQGAFSNRCFSILIGDQESKLHIWEKPVEQSDAALVS